MRAPPEVSLPEGTVDLVRELVPPVRALLARGLSDDFQRSCVRIGCFTRFTGGLKSSLVGGLRIDVRAVLKLGGPDLVLHERLMQAVNQERRRTFPTVLDRVELDAGRQFLLLEDLHKYATVLHLVYHRSLTATAATRILDHTIGALLAIRETGRIRREVLADIPIQPEPFSRRLREKLHAVLEADPELQPLRDQPGQVVGVPCPPLNLILENVECFLTKTASRLAPVLQHGDPHLGNIMVRARGHGWSVLLIDPNPEVGFSDPLYDVGKLLHWAEPVGWAQVKPEMCEAEWQCRKGGWTLNARCKPLSAAAERRRERLHAGLLERIPRLLPDEPESSWRARLPLAIAAAHIGLAALFKEEDKRPARRFALAHTLRHLAEWWRECRPGA